MDNKIMMDPDKYGYVQCPHCNGFGSSLKDHEDVLRCTKYGGTGLIKKK